MTTTALILNILWIVLGGGIGCLIFWAIAGVLLALTVVGLPFSFAAFRIARFAFIPFGQTLIDAREIGESRVTGTSAANVIWFVLAGLWLFLFHAVAGLLLCVTIIGIPFGLAHFKLATVSLAPLGKRAVVPSELPGR